MIYIVDGTGDFRDSDYSVAMAGSHCNMLYYMNKTSARYWRGPDLFDLVTRTSRIAIDVHGEVMRNEFPSALLALGARQSPKSPIILVGYSRGGAAVVRVARKLAEREIPVAAMFLFDAVDRTVSLDDVETVPGNVCKCYHAVRNEGAEIVMEAEVRQLWKKCEQAAGFNEAYAKFTRVGSGRFQDFLRVQSASLSPELNRAVTNWKKRDVTLQRLKVAMRNSFGMAAGTTGIELSIPFGNCARKYDPNCKDHKTEEFAGTHAALGGTPWTTLGDEIQSMDRDTSVRVWTWMSSKMRECGIRAFSNV
jgi:pimeloyl-ACP methyl ester carboxylesterase